jgi:hypothetical protein
MKITSQNWYGRAWIALGILYLGVNIIYFLLGGSGVQIGGATISFNRTADNTLYEISDRWAFNVRVGATSGVESFSIVNYRRDLSPLGWVCGSCVLDGGVMNNAHYRKGDIVYTEFPHLSGVDVVNLATGEVFEIDAAEPPPGQRVNPEAIPLYRELGLTFDPEYKLSVANIGDAFERLPAQAESCVVVQLAFWFMFGVLLLLGIPRLINRFRPTTSAS